MHSMEKKESQWKGPRKLIKKAQGRGSQTWEAVLVHFPVGMFTAYLSIDFWLISAFLFGGFLTYEVVEDWREEDRGYRDIFGFLLGLSAGAIGLVVFSLFKGTAFWM